MPFMPTPLKTKEQLEKRKKVFSIVLTLIIVFSSLSILLYFSFSPGEDKGTQSAVGEGNIEIFVAQDLNATIVQKTNNLVLLLEPLKSLTNKEREISDIFSKNFRVFGVSCLDTEDNKTICRVELSKAEEKPLETMEDYKMLFSQILSSIQNRAALVELYNVVFASVSGEASLTNINTGETLTKDITGTYKTQVLLEDLDSSKLRTAAFFYLQEKTMVNAILFSQTSVDREQEIKAEKIEKTDFYRVVISFDSNSSREEARLTLSSNFPYLEISDSEETSLYALDITYRRKDFEDFLGRLRAVLKEGAIKKTDQQVTIIFPKITNIDGKPTILEENTFSLYFDKKAVDENRFKLFISKRNNVARVIEIKPAY